MSTISDFQELLSKLEEIDIAISGKNATLGATTEKLQGLQREVALETKAVEKLFCERVGVIEKIRASVEELVTHKGRVSPQWTHDVSLLPILSLKVDTLIFDVRCLNCCRTEHIYFIGDLVQRTEHGLRAIPNLGKKSVNLIKEILAENELSLGTTLKNWVRPGE